MTRHPKAVEALCGVLELFEQDQYYDLGTDAVVQALVRIGDIRSARVLVKLIEHDDSSARRAACQALDQLGWVPGDPRERALRALAHGGMMDLAHLGVEEVPTMVEALQRPQFDGRELRQILNRLAEIGDSRSIVPLVTLAARRPADIRTEIVSSLLTLGWTPNTDVEREWVAERNEKIARSVEEGNARKARTRDRVIVATLSRLCLAYASSDRAEVERLEPIATKMGEELDARGGIAEMRRIFVEVPDQKGKRTLEMHWGGVGDWLG
jgi:hypothetical protein